jgi:PAS domain S-box-containing protein
VQRNKIDHRMAEARWFDAPIGIAHIALDSRFLRVNQMVCRILGYSADELLTKSLRDTTHPDDLAVGCARWELIRDGKIDSYDAETRHQRKDGSTVWVRVAGRCVRKSGESWLEQSGYSREELRRLEDWATLAYPKRSDEVLKYLRGNVSDELQGMLCYERTIHTKDGRERPWRFFRAALGIQSDGRRLFVAMAYDVSDQSKAYENQILFLLRESNHRAKNMLSLVQAIARQTAARRPEDFVAHFNERIRALASSQDLLVRNKWQGADVGDLVRAQLAHFADVVGSRITDDGPRLRLNAVAAQAIGLALHELATNAAKYGALSVDAGHVDVSWRLEGDKFMMSWTERNGPPVSRPERRGFGSTVVDAMAKQSLGGQVELNYAPSGLRWHLACPAANALERWERDSILAERGKTI